MFRMLLIFLNKTELIFCKQNTFRLFVGCWRVESNFIADHHQAEVLEEHDKRRWSFLSFCQRKSFMIEAEMWEYGTLRWWLYFLTLEPWHDKEKFFAMILGIFNSFFIGWIVDYRGSIMKEWVLFWIITKNQRTAPGSTKKLDWYWVFSKMNWSLA